MKTCHCIKISSFNSICNISQFKIKTPLQSRANAAIAVGTQHPHDSMLKGFSQIFKEQGIKGIHSMDIFIFFSLYLYNFNFGRLLLVNCFRSMQFFKDIIFYLS